MRIERSTANDISSDKREAKIQLVKKDGSEDLILTLTNIFYLPNSS